MKRTQMTGMAAAVLVAASLALAGCGGDSSLGANEGGKTTCGDYKVLSPEDKKKVVTDLLKERGQQNPPNGAITAAQAAADTYCATLATDQDPISKMAPTPSQ